MSEKKPLIEVNHLKKGNVVSEGEKLFGSN